MLHLRKPFNFDANSVRQLVHQGQVGLIQGSAVEEYVRQVNPALYARASKYPATFPIEKAIISLT